MTPRLIFETPENSSFTTKIFAFIKMLVLALTIVYTGVSAYTNVKRDIEEKPSLQEVQQIVNIELVRSENRQKETFYRKEDGAKVEERVKNIKESVDSALKTLEEIRQNLVALVLQGRSKNKE